MERHTPPPPSAGTPGPTLVGLLAHLDLLDRATAPPAFVEGMGRWLGWQSAIALSAVLQAPVVSRAPAPVPGPADNVAKHTRAFQQVRKNLTRAILDDQATAANSGLDFVPFQRRYNQLQQAMGTAIGPLRAQLRAAVARQSPALTQLAALDAAMAEALAPQEQTQLGQMTALLYKHFTRLRQAQAAPDAATHWLGTFRHDMQRLLLAELALRLQPAQGLLDTLCGVPEEHHELA